MKHSNLKSNVLESFFLEFLIMGIVILLAGIPLNGYAQQTDDELTKEVDFSKEVTEVAQEHDYWCVYACLSSINTSSPQCTHCFNFLHQYYMSGRPNPYQSVRKDDFDNAIKDLKADANKTCTSSSTYANFGVTGEKCDEYLRYAGFSKTSMGVFYEKITQVNSSPSITFFIDSGDCNAGHCVVFMGSKLYNNDWYDPNSKIELMDPAFGCVRETTYGNLQTTYDAIYSK